MRIYVVCNFKGGSGKSTTAVHLAHEFRSRGYSTLLVDSDPQGSATRWSEAGFPFPVVGMAVPNLHQQLSGVARGRYDVVVVDTPPVETRRAIVTSALRVATEAVVTLAPTTMEMDTLPDIWGAVEDVEPVRVEPLRTVVLLNRTVFGANSTKDARTLLADDGRTVLEATVPRLERYAQALGAPVTDTGHYAAVTDELLARVAA